MLVGLTVTLFSAITPYTGLRATRGFKSGVRMFSESTPLDPGAE